tara:strand:- start:3084 stop:5969 length:2886 start_codon:yes stop_codon:yes gene_type:complete
MSNDRVDSFKNRHLGSRESEIERMLSVVKADSLDQLIDEVVPSKIKSKKDLEIQLPETERDFLERLRVLGSKNACARSFIGAGYYGTILPSVILRNVFENPGWYTPYTPYQAEISQGRLEALLNYQTMIEDMTGMEVSNASLLDEGTAVAEGMMMGHRVQKKKRHLKNRCVVSESCFSQTIEVLKGRADPLGIEIKISSDEKSFISGDTFALVLQNPDADGRVRDIEKIIETAHANDVFVVVATDLLASVLIKPPGEVGADVVVGSAQRFGVPMGYGGPHAAFFATKEAHIRQVPGRLIGVSIDSHGRRAYRMTLQTREQHIRRERATSNICTAQALLANIAGFYAVYHGQQGLSEIAQEVHKKTLLLADKLSSLGCTLRHREFFDTIRIDAGGMPVTRRIREAAEKKLINFRYFDDGDIGISIDETAKLTEIDEIIRIFESAKDESRVGQVLNRNKMWCGIPGALRRQTEFLTHPVFKCNQSELQMMRYLKRLELKDLGLDTSMIPLGSCTMKLNAATEMRGLSWAEFSDAHPFSPVNQMDGYHVIFEDLMKALCEITGFYAVSLQPNSGSQGEFAGLMVIRKFHRSQGQGQRDVVLIPASAHGTNPASAAMAGMKIVIVECDAGGNVNVEDLKKKLALHRDRLNALMITYPSTHGVFEDEIQEICNLVHESGGQVYMDGANLNAQVGLTSPALIGADVCHLNLHKTFAIPHGGGGPGMGPIAVAKHLSPFLPGHPVVPTGGLNAIGPVSAAPWGSASILLISYAYICLLGRTGLKEATRVAILNANYIKSRLEGHYDVLYSGASNRVAHELIFDLRSFKGFGVNERDVAKRLMDYGFHAPTVSFPVAGTLMIEPTESEPLEELDRFCDAMISIRMEINEVKSGRVDQVDNVLKNAPHTAEELVGNEWDHPYSRESAAFPLEFVRRNKYWPPVSRINDAHGDRNLMCSCPPLESYAKRNS